MEKLVKFTVDERNVHYSSINGDLYSKNGKYLIQYAIGKKDSRIIFSEAINTICESAASYCSHLKILTFPTSVESMLIYSFLGCENLESIHISKNVEIIGERAFDMCSSLSNITVENGNKRYYCIDNVLFDKQERKLIQYPLSKKNDFYIIPKEINIVGNSSFKGNKFLTSVFLPKTIEIIEWRAFFDLRNFIIYSDASARNPNWHNQMKSKDVLIEFNTSDKEYESKRRL